MKRQKVNCWAVFAILAIAIALIFISLAVATPVGPTSINVTDNETKTASPAQMINISGGYISKINISASTQDLRWKAFVGWVDGRFTLSDAAGATIYNWKLTTTSGQVYATRTNGAITWASTACATVPDLETENTAMSLTNKDDNISATFKDTTHKSFAVGSVNINANSCPTLNTYVNNVTQDTSFEEVTLKAGSAIIYAALLENRITGYNGSTYDFQMIVPENGSATWTGATAYYLYIELS